MNELKAKKMKLHLLRTALFFIFFLLELYLYVFVRNDNILDLFVTIAAGILFIGSLMIYFKHFKDRNSD